MKLFIPQNLLSSASMTSTEHLRRDDVEARPSRSKIRSQMTDSPRIPLIVDYGRNRRLRIPITSVLLNCYTANAIASMLTLRCQTIEWTELLVLSAIYTIGLRGSTIKAREPSSQFHSFVRESYWQHPMGFSLRKLQTSISPEPLIVQRADFAWKFIWARGIG